MSDVSESISLRTATDDDIPLLKRVYASTRQEELSQVPWDDATRQAFLEHQFNAQHTFYHEHFADATYSLILEDERPVGRLYVDRREDEIRILDIALLPEHRGKGIGSALIEGLLAEAASVSKPVKIHVLPFNPAIHLYERLGFTKAGETGVHLLMQWTPVS